MNRTLAAAALATTAMALGPIAQAAAADAYMGGLFGGTPGYNSITGPEGQRISTNPTWLGGDERIRYDNISVQSAVRAQAAWLEQHQGEQNTLWVYSESAQAVKVLANDRPELFTNTRVIAIAPPRPGSLGYEEVAGPNPVRIHVAIVGGDSVADPGGTSFDTHLNGYRNLNMQATAPLSTTTVPGTATTVNYYKKPSASAPATSEPVVRKTGWEWVAKLFKPRTTTAVAADADAAAEPKRSTWAERAAERKAERKAASDERAAARAERAAARKAASEERATARQAKQAEQESSDDSQEAAAPAE